MLVAVVLLRGALQEATA